MVYTRSLLLGLPDDGYYDEELGRDWGSLFGGTSRRSSSSIRLRIGSSGDSGSTTKRGVIPPRSRIDQLVLETLDMIKTLAG